MDIIILITGMVIIALTNAEMDIIKFHPNKALFKSDWWIKNKNVNMSYFNKTVLSFTMDGWHFCKFIMRITECFLFSYFVYNSIAIIVIGTVVIYAIIGSIFELWYSK